MIGGVQELGGRLIIGLGLVVAAVAAIGYVFVYSNIATPVGRGLGTFEIPAPGEVVATWLDDGRPAYLLQVDGEALVIDARTPHDPGTPQVLVAWCDGAGAFLDLVRGGAWAPGGEVTGGSADSGLNRYATQPAGDGRVGVRDELQPAGSATAEPGATECPAGSTWVAHAPEPREIFDPSVAADGEPPGWIWLEGTLQVVDGEVRLCDGLDGACDAGADVTGIDPARVDPGAGLFLGRVLDHVVENLVIVPNIPTEEAA